MQAMKDLNIGSMVIATVYKQSINQAVRKYYEDGGLEVLSIKGGSGQASQIISPISSTRASSAAFND
jgi:maleate cis-trans isomerase